VAMGGYALRSLHLFIPPWSRHRGLYLTTWLSVATRVGDYYNPPKKKHRDVLEPSILSALSEVLATSVLLAALDCCWSCFP
jgi:hypothetical protein